MIIFKQNGRLGNQIFQYCGLKTEYGDKETLVLWGFEQLDELFEGIEAVIINSKTSAIKRKLSNRVLNFIHNREKKNWFQTVRESKNGELSSTDGWYNRIKIFDDCFFQSENKLDFSHVHKLKFRKNLVQKAQRTFTEMGCENKNKIFIHVRRGDYFKWPDSNYPAVLPDNYYRRLIDNISTTNPNTFFIFTSDEPGYVEQAFKGIKNSAISKLSALEDFVLMSMCDGGILSASSFSWWASWFISQKNPDAVLIAPTYWGGHRKKIWFPKQIKASFLQYELVA